MGFLDSVNTELKKAVEEGWGVLKEGARVGKLRYRLFTIHKEAEKHFSEIGGIVYEAAKTPLMNPLSDPRVLELVDKIGKIEAETEALESEIKKDRKDVGANP